MLKPDFAFKQTVIVQPYKGLTGTGKPIYAEPIEMKCRIEPSTRKVIDAKGNEVIASGFIMLTAGTRLEAGSIIVWEGVRYSLIKLAPQYTFEESHVEGWLK